MVQGVNKEYIFNKNEYMEKYLNIINKNKANYNFTIMAYCIMNNHAHFLVYTENIGDWGKFMHIVNLLYAQMYNKKENRCGVLFRNRYKSEPIYDRNHLINCIKYIHNNPVKAKIVSRCDEYKYSSFKDYIENKGIAKSKIVKEIFGEECDFSAIFTQECDTRFMDIDEESNEEINEYIKSKISIFNNLYGHKTYEIFCYRELLKELIDFLNHDFKIKYTEISNFFEMPRGTMEKLKIKR